MQFTTAASLLFAAIAAASPASVQERQAPSVTAIFHRSGGCNGGANDIITPPSPLVLVQDSAPCHNIVIPETVGCTELTASTLSPNTRLRVYNQPNCPETGNVNFWTYTQGDNNNKFGQNVRSYRFL